MTGHATELANLGKTRQAHIAALNAGDAHRWAAGPAPVWPIGVDEHHVAVAGDAQGIYP